LKRVIKDVTSRWITGEKKTRLLIYGSIIDSSETIRLIEDCGANVVIDDLCFGTKAYWHEVAISEDPLASLARYYLNKITCPRTYRSTVKQRFGHIARFAKDFQIDGVIVDAVRFCDPVKLEVPELKEYLQKNGLPALHIEDDYNIDAYGALKTRIQAFVEMLRRRR
jgi:benzoyl-CoA reductase subunit C